MDVVSCSLVKCGSGLTVPAPPLWSSQQIAVMWLAR
jgi:hypothetical protein